MKRKERGKEGRWKGGKDRQEEWKEEVKVRSDGRKKKMRKGRKE